MATYEVKIVSQKNAAILLITTLVLFFSYAYFIIPHGTKKSGLSYVVIVATVVVAYVLWQKFVTGRTKWVIDNNGINIIWIKQFALNDRKDIFIRWDDIKSIKRGVDPNYYNIKIKLITGKTLKFYGISIGKDFQEFVKELNINK